jgi:hypothetical protein
MSTWSLVIRGQRDDPLLDDTLIFGRTAKEWLELYHEYILTHNQTQIDQIRARLIKNEGKLNEVLEITELPNGDIEILIR